MGQDQSRNGSAEDQEAFVQAQQAELKAVEGFQVVRLLPHSPAHQGGLVPYFDIITALDDEVLSGNGSSQQQPPHDHQAPRFRVFKNYLFEHRDRQVRFTVYSLRIRSYREVWVTPSDAWGGGGLLGCSVEWARADEAVQRCYHVVGVLEGSPAAYCSDLRAERDYIVGMQQPDVPLVAMFKGSDDFYARVSVWQELQRTALERRSRFPEDRSIVVPHSLLLLVYDSEENGIKEVVVDMGMRPGTPLGLSVATGLLHMIPAVDTVASAAAAGVAGAKESAAASPEEAAPQQQQEQEGREGWVAVRPMRWWRLCRR